VPLVIFAAASFRTGMPSSIITKGCRSPVVDRTLSFHGLAKGGLHGCVAVRKGQKFVPRSQLKCYCAERRKLLILYTASTSATLTFVRCSLVISPTSMLSKITGPNIFSFAKAIAVMRFFNSVITESNSPDLLMKFIRCDRTWLNWVWILLLMCIWLFSACINCNCLNLIYSQSSKSGIPAVTFNADPSMLTQRLYLWYILIVSINLRIFRMPESMTSTLCFLGKVFVNDDVSSTKVP